MAVPLPDLDADIAGHVRAAAVTELFDPLIFALGDFAHDADGGAGEAPDPDRRPGRRAEQMADSPARQLDTYRDRDVREHVG